MYSAEEIRSMYQRHAYHFDRSEAPVEVMLLSRRRRRLLANASGSVLEVAVGTGRNIPHYPARCEVTGIDISPAMLEIAKQKAADRSGGVELTEGDAENLPFADDSFDTVTSTLSLCTFPRPVAALKEMRRVCRPDGRILLLEHGRCNWPFIGAFQDRTADRNAKLVGCYWNRRPLQLAERAGLDVVGRRVSYGGFLTEMVVSPGEGGQGN